MAAAGEQHATAGRDAHQKSDPLIDLGIEMNTVPSILDRLSPDLYIAGDDVDARYSSDWSGKNPCLPAVVLRPRTVEDVSTMLGLCSNAGQPIVIQGGRTGLSGGATPRAGEWALSLERLNRISEIDAAALYVTVEAGTLLQTIQNRALEIGCRFPLDIGARGSCLAGGLVSTNAGGIQVIRFGSARSLVLGLVAVLADGTIVEARNLLLKNNAGLDVKQLFIGSEGILGVVTEVTFRLVPMGQERHTFLCALSSFEQVIALLNILNRGPGPLCAFEAMWANYYIEALRATRVSDPFGGAHPYYVLAELESASAQGFEAALESILGSALSNGVIVDAVIAKSRSEARALWSLREAVAEIHMAFSPAADFDIGLPLKSMGGFVSAVQLALGEAIGDCRMVIFGHIGDGNLHIMASTGKSDDLERIYDLVYRHTQGIGGTITAEHGIGVIKKPWLGLSRSENEIALMRVLKKTLDGKNILNRGRVI
jgi:FAD/FMN-containing dehydrogenase